MNIVALTDSPMACVQEDGFVLSPIAMGELVN